MTTNSKLVATCAAIAMLSLGSGCGWNRMDSASKGTTVGAAGGAVTGAVVGGPIGAVVGAGVGAYAGNVAGGGTVEPGNATTSSRGYDSTLVRSVQVSLNDKGFTVGTVDGQWGPATEDGVRRFQRAMNLPVTGDLESRTLAALGVR